MTAWARDTGSCSGSRLPYSLRFELVVTDLDRPTLLGGAASGELTGPAGGPWPPDGTGTLVTYDWKVSTTSGG